jgi:hypothetical protein
MAPGKQGVYTGGKGILVRNLLDGLVNSKLDVVPGSFLVNDMKMPSSVYPSGNPECPNDGNSGYNNFERCSDGPWELATVAVVIGDDQGGNGMSKIFTNFDTIQANTWGWGVFYGSDSNSVDQRCRWLPSDEIYDCPGGYIAQGTWHHDSSKLGAGYYPPGNPTLPDQGNAGGGSGCHFANYAPYSIDQTDSSRQPNLVQDSHCQCNYKLSGNKWGDWYRQWKSYAQPKPDFEWQGWFGRGKAPSFALDFASCWVNNPRDMINIQNTLWENKYDWSNQLIPKSFWNDNNPSSLRPYWGWNEVPIDRVQAHSPINWDALAIKLPAAVCGNNGFDDKMSCLSSAAEQQLQQDLYTHIKSGFLVPGASQITKRPGSYVVILKEQLVGSGTWQRFFYCENWKSPDGKLQIVFTPESSSSPTGACYIDYA